MLKWNNREVVAIKMGVGVKHIFRLKISKVQGS